MTLDASGRLGVGETSPTSRIHANGTIQAITGATGVQIYGDGGSGYVNSVGANPLIFQVNSTERARIDSSGNLLVGTSSASARLHVAIDASTGADLLTLENTNSGNNTTKLAGLKFQGRDTINSGKVTGYVRVNPVESDYINSVMTFWTRGSDSVAERMRLDSYGNLLLGQTGTGYQNSNSSYLSNQAFIQSHASGTGNATKYAGFGYAGSEIGSITQAGTTATAYNTSSDYRLKNITGPVTNSGAYIDSLNPVEGTWKTDGSTFVGLIAHEAQEVSRTPVATGVKDGKEMQSMDYSSSEIIANLIAEIKSLRVRVAHLESN
jgi:hypothetical protein